MVSYLPLHLKFSMILGKTLSPLCLSFFTYTMGIIIGGLDFSGGSNDKESACKAGDLVWSLGQEDPLEMGMTTHSSILAWRILQTEEPGRLQVHGVAKSPIRLKRLSTHARSHIMSMYLLECVCGDSWRLGLRVCVFQEDLYVGVFLWYIAETCSPVWL